MHESSNGNDYNPEAMNPTPEASGGVNENPEEVGVHPLTGGDVLNQYHAEWLAKVQDMEAKNEQYLRAIRAEGKNPDEDPDYQFFLGQLVMARDELLKVVTEKTVKQIEDSEQ